MAEDLEPQPYLGAPVTLISSLDVRYEGILFTIDPNESTVALQNVKCLGTEDRASGDKVIPKSDTVYEFIIFRGENIKTICLSEGTEPKEKSPINDPSILKVGPTGTAPIKTSARAGQPHHAPHPRQNHNQLQSQRRYHHHNNHHNNDNRWAGQQRYPQNQHHYNNQRNRYNGPPNRRYYRYDNRRGRNPHHQYRRNNRYNNNNRRNPRYRNSEYAPGNAQFLTRSQENPENPAESLKDDFDFAGANARFSKNEFEEEHDEPQPEVKEVQKDPAQSEKKPTEEVEEENTSEKKEPVVEKGDKEVVVENKGDPAKASPPKFEYKYDAEVSFFDDLDAGFEQRSNRNAKQRREVDTKTFGSIAANYAPRTYRNRYKGRRRYNRNRY